MTLDRRSLLTGGLSLAAAAAWADQAPTRVPLKPLWPTAAKGTDVAMEELLLRLTNEARAAADVPPVRPLESLAVAARQHSVEMVEERYFAHESPHEAWREPADRAYRAGYWEAYVAENIIFIDTGGGRMPAEQLAREFMHGGHGWMNSPPHRANILSRDYTHLGIGVYIQGGRHFATQVFGRHHFELADLALEPRRREYVVTGRARPTGDPGKVYIALDNKILATTPVTKDEWFDVRWPVPREGRHRLGLHPAKDQRSYWIRWILYLDGDQRPEQALIMPFDP